jgi:hypothetical protein
VDLAVPSGRDQLPISVVRRAHPSGFVSHGKSQLFSKKMSTFGSDLHWLRSTLFKKQGFDPGVRLAGSSWNQQDASGGRLMSEQGSPDGGKGPLVVWITLVVIRSEDTIATTFLATLSLKNIPPEMLKVTISELFKRFHGHAAARKSEVIDFQSTFDLGALFTLKDWPSAENH